MLIAAHSASIIIPLNALFVNSYGTLVKNSLTLSASPRLLLMLRSTLSFYSEGWPSGMMAGMVDFEHFVDGLGPHAKHYTPQQLKQLHLEVRRLADFLLEAYKARTVAKKGQRSPQPFLDGSNGDRTIESVLTERVDGPDPPQAQDS